MVIIQMLIIIKSHYYFYNIIMGYKMLKDVDTSKTSSSADDRRNQLTQRCTLWGPSTDYHKENKDLGERLLRNTARYNHIQAAEKLLIKGVNVNGRSKKTNQTALHIAARKGHLAMVTLLLKYKARIEQDDYYLAPASIEKFTYDTATVSPKRGMTALSFAVTNNHYQVAYSLLVNGADPNTETIGGLTPLCLAVLRGDTKMISLLLTYRANIDHRTRSGLTPLAIAGLNKDTNVTSALLQSGADIAALPDQLWKLKPDCINFIIEVQEDMLAKDSKDESDLSVGFSDESSEDSSASEPPSPPLSPRDLYA